METVRSADGTPIAITRAGDGPALVLVGGSLDDGAENAQLASALAGSFTVVNYARRGRGASGGWSGPYALERELEDLAAVMCGPAMLHGVSTGGALALQAVHAGLPVDAASVYEVPFGTAPWWSAAWSAYVSELDELLAAGREGDALALFMRFAGVPEKGVAAARADPAWLDHARRAPSLAWDAALLGDGRPPAWLAALRVPLLVLTGGTDPFFTAAADAIAALVPGADRRVVAGQGHVADPAAIAPLLTAFPRPR